MHNDLDRAREALSHIPSDDRGIWVKMAMATKSEFGDAGYDIWESWSMTDESFSEQDARSVWRSVRADGGIGIASLFREAKEHGWHDNGNYRKPTPEELVERKRAAAERQAKEEAAVVREQKDTAAKALAVFRAAGPASAGHPYLRRKQVAPVTSLREIDASAAAEILGYTPKSSSGPLSRRLLAVPVVSEHGLATLELIDEGGRKTALAGRGTKVGGYWATERLPPDNGAGLALLIGEGVATVLSAASAVSCPGVAALANTNLPVVAKAMRGRYPLAELVILADLVKTTGEPDPHAVEAARATGGLLAAPNFGPDRPPGLKDFNDLSISHGAEAVAMCIDAAAVPVEDGVAPAREPAEDAPLPGQEDPSAAEDAPLPAEQGEPAEAPAREQESPAPKSDDERIVWLAGLSAAEYERVRASEAKCLGFRATALDKIVASERQRAESDGGIGFDDVEPWPHPVAGDQLLSDIANVINRFIVCKPETAHAAALWATMTWLTDVIETCPLALITAPEMRCGKSQLLTVLGKLSRRPVVASNISPPALFRVIDLWQPTLMIDEADAFMRENEELRGVINSGHKRDSAYVIRCEGEDFTPKQFSTWGAKAIAGIGHLADTLMDRSIILDLRRKMPHENVERLRYAEPGLFPTLAAKLCRWTDDNREAVRRARPDLSKQLNDRSQDNWEPLLSIADVAGGVWRELAPRVAVAISGQGNEDGLTVGAELLSGIREVFETKRVERISTSELIEALCSDDERPWVTFNRGRPISPRQMAKRLKSYGVASKTMRIGYGNCKGYELSQFLDAFSRYLPSPPSASVTASQASSQAGLSVADNQSAYVTESAHPSHVTNLRQSDGQKRSSTESLSPCNPGHDHVTDKGNVTVTQTSSVTPEASRSKGCDVVTDKRGGAEDSTVEVEI